MIDRSALRRNDLLLAKTGGRCAYCGHVLVRATVTADHVVPRARGGGRGENLLPACAACNSEKGRRTLEEWRRSIERANMRMPSFTKEQRRWLTAHGFVFPEPDRFLFWFEMQDDEKEGGTIA